MRKRKNRKFLKLIKEGDWVQIGEDRVAIPRHQGNWFLVKRADLYSLLLYQLLSVNCLNIRERKAEIRKRRSGAWIYPKFEIVKAGRLRNNAFYNLSTQRSEPIPEEIKQLLSDKRLVK